MHAWMDYIKFSVVQIKFSGRRITEITATEVMAMEVTTMDTVDGQPTWEGRRRNL